MSDFYNKYPYTDFHELNLDWVIARVKQLTEDWLETKQAWENTEADWQELHDYVMNYFANLNLQNEVNTKLNEMVADGTLDALIIPILNQYEASITGRIQTLEARMSEFASLPDGSTAGDAELEDIRIPATGFNVNEAYDSAGDAVRGQVSTMTSALAAVSSENDNLLFDIKPYSMTYSSGYYRPTDGSSASSTTHIKSPLIPVTGKFAIIHNGDFDAATNIIFFINVYDSTKSFVRTINASGLSALNGRQIVVNENRELYYVGVSITFETPRTMSDTYVAFISSRVSYYETLKNAVISVDSSINTLSAAIGSYGVNYQRHLTATPQNNYDDEKKLSISTGARTAVNISRQGKVYGTDFDIRSKILPGGTTYFISPNGNDSNTGLSSNVPLKTFDAALLKSNVKTIIVESGDYFMGTNFTEAMTFSDVNIICPTEARIIFAPAITYTDADYLGNQYTLVGTGTRYVIDGDTLKPYIRENSPVSLDYYHAYIGSGGAIVRMPVKPTINNIYRIGNQAGWKITGDAYIEGLTFIGGYRGVETEITDADVIAFNSCRFMYSRNNGFTALGGSYYMFNCEARYNYLDGFNYHQATGSYAHATEIKCAGYDNGYNNVDDTSYSNNGSTIHDYGKIIRINCRYGTSKGGVIADSAADSYNFGCEAFSSTCRVAAVPANNCCIEAINGTTMYLYDCFTYGSDYDLTCADGNNTVNSTIDYSLKSLGASDTFNVIS